MFKDFKLNQRMEERSDIYNVSHAVEDALYDYARRKRMTVVEARKFFIWSLNQIMSEATQDLNAAIEELIGTEDKRYHMPRPIFLKDNNE